MGEARCGHKKSAKAQGHIIRQISDWVNHAGIAAVSACDLSWKVWICSQLIVDLWKRIFAEQSILFFKKSKPGGKRAQVLITQPKVSILFATLDAANLFLGAFSYIDSIPVAGEVNS